MKGLVRKSKRTAQRVSDDDDSSIWVFSTSNEFDRDDETIDVRGIDMHASGVPIPFVDNHDTESSVTAAILGHVVRSWVEKVGEGTRYPQVKGPARDGLLGQVRWNTATQAGREAKEMCRLRMLNNASLSFLPTSPPQRNARGKNHYPTSEAIEVSATIVPSNRSAVRVKRASLGESSGGAGGYLEDDTGEEVDSAVRDGAYGHHAKDWLGRPGPIKPGDTVTYQGTAGMIMSMRVLEVENGEALVERGGRQYWIELGKLQKDFDGEPELDEADEERLLAKLEKLKHKTQQFGDRLNGFQKMANLVALQQHLEDAEMAGLAYFTRRR